MMASSLVSGPGVTSSNVRPDRSSSACESKRRKKRKSRAHPQPQWRSETHQRAYSSKLLQALAHARLRGGGAVREAADRALATAARGRTRWSQAILTSRRLRVKFRKKQNKRRQGAAVAGPRKSKVRVTGLRRRAVPAVQRKVKVLGRLVPGCRKEPLPVILEEASYYIAALEMQIRAMTALAQLLSGAGPSSASPQPPSQ